MGGASSGILFPWLFVKQVTDVTLNVILVSRSPAPFIFLKYELIPAHRLSARGQWAPSFCLAQTEVVTWSEELEGDLAVDPTPFHSCCGPVSFLLAKNMPCDSNLVEYRASRNDGQIRIHSTEFIPRVPKKIILCEHSDVDVREITRSFLADRKSQDPHPSPAVCSDLRSLLPCRIDSK